MVIEPFTLLQEAEIGYAVIKFPHEHLINLQEGWKRQFFVKLQGTKDSETGKNAK